MLPPRVTPGGLLLRLWVFSWKASCSVAAVPLKKQSGVVVWFLAVPSACWALPTDRALWDALAHRFRSTSRQPFAETEPLGNVCGAAVLYRELAPTLQLPWKRK